MYKPLNQYHVVMEVEPRFWQNPDSLRYIYINGRGGVQVPLSAVCSFISNTTPLAVNHTGQFSSVTISFNLQPGFSLGEAVDEIEAAAHRIGMPSTLRGTFLGTAQAFQASLKNEPILILAARVGRVHRAGHFV